MAISEDTVAIVAAQLTSAWATRRGPQTIGDQKLGGPDEGVLAAYVRFKGLVAERDITREPLHD